MGFGAGAFRPHSHLRLSIISAASCLERTKALLVRNWFGGRLQSARIPIPTANVLMGRDSFAETIGRLERLVAASDAAPSVKADFRSWYKLARDAMQRRDQLVHSAWIAPGTRPLEWIG